MKHSLEIRIDLIEETDSETLRDLVQSNSEHLMEYFPFTVDTIVDQNKSKCFVLDKIEASKERKGYYFKILKDKNLVGIISLRDVDWSIPKAEIGYFIDRENQGKGITTRAIGLLLDFCFSEMKMKKIYARVEKSNRSSIQTLLRNNFTKEGTLRADFKNGKNEVINSQYFSILRDEYYAYKEH